LEREIVILLTLISYNSALLLIGFWATRRTKDNSDFFLGGRGLGATVASVSYAASSSSAWSLLGFSGMVYFLGASAIWFVPGIMLGHYLSWKFIGPRLMEQSRSKNYLTTTDLLAGNSTGTIRQCIIVTASLFIVISFAFYVAAQFEASANTFSSSFDISKEMAVVIGATIIMIYTLLGGFWAVSVTDTLQGLLMVAVSILLPVAAIIAMGGFGGMIEGLRAELTPEQFSLTGQNSALAFLGLMVGVMGLSIGAFGQPQLLTRFMALKDEQALRRGRIIATTWFGLIFGAMYIVGLAGHVLVDNVGNSELVFFDLTNQLFPSILAGIVSAAVLSAIMSTADSQLLVAASAVSHDLGFEKRFGVSPILISRIVIVLLCLASVWITLQLPDSIFDRVVFAWSALGSAFGPVVIGRALGARTRQEAVLAAMIVGFSITVGVHFTMASPPPLLERVVPFLVGLIIVFGVTEKRSVSVQTEAAE